MRWPKSIPGDRVCDEMASSIDFYPTLASLAGAEVPTDRMIDGIDISGLLKGERTESGRDTFFYYWGNALEAVRHRNFKLHLLKGDKETKELYDLSVDVGEKRNVFDNHPDVVEQLTRMAEDMGRDIGDEALGIKGQNCRPIGRVECPDTLTHFDPTYPYFMAEYDLADRG